MNKSELIQLKKILKNEIDRRNRINELLSNELIQEFLVLNNLNFRKLNASDKWSVLKELLEEFKITETNGILVCIGNYIETCRIYYQETEYYAEEVPFDNQHIQFQTFEDIETSKVHTAYKDKYIERSMEDDWYGVSKNMTPSEFCASKFRSPLVSELSEKYTILNPTNSSENENGFEDVQKDFFVTAIEKGQSKAKQLVLSKYSGMR